ncbi:MAG TPA: heme ABC transporter ATP-binding protein [Polyangiaceae bacterium]|nr:heme ABC transporter ATP-binding protein [Polyangiaceae bacterium]
MSEVAALGGRAPARALRPGLALPALGALLAASALASLAVGAFYVAPADVLAVVAHRLHLAPAPDVSPQAAAVVWAVRAPRTLLAAGVGAALGASGGVMQGVFRNPLVDPGLFGVSSGAGLGAVAAIVLGAKLARGLPPALAPYVTQAAAFAGALAATWLWLRLARAGGRANLAGQLLTGIAINAGAASLLGFLVFLANDAQLRTITFWNLGSVGGATWPLLAALALALAPALALLPRLARPPARRPAARRGRGGAPWFFRRKDESHGHRPGRARRRRLGRRRRRRLVRRPGRAPPRAPLARPRPPAPRAGRRARRARRPGRAHPRRPRRAAPRGRHRRARRPLLSRAARARGAPVFAVIEARALAYRAGGRALVDGVDLRVEPGELVCLLGPNGAGKSTLLRLLAGELRPSAGSALVLGRELARWAPRELARVRAVMAQESRLEFAFRALDVVLLGRAPHLLGAEGPRDHAVARGAMAEAGVLALAERSYPTLSGGERQRVQAARALAQIWDVPGPRALLLDEPTASLDWPHQHALLALLRRLAGEGVAVVCVLHDLHLAAQYATRVVLLRRGRVVRDGPPREAFVPELLRETFDVRVLVFDHPTLGFPLVLSADAASAPLGPRSDAPASPAARPSGPAPPPDARRPDAPHAPTEAPP